MNIFFLVFLFGLFIVAGVMFVAGLYEIMVHLDRIIMEKVDDEELKVHLDRIIMEKVDDEELKPELVEFKDKDKDSEAFFEANK